MRPMFRLKKDSALEPNAKAGTIVYSPRGWDYGLANDDTRLTGIAHKSVTLSADGESPTFTVPVADLEEVRP